MCVVVAPEESTGVGTTGNTLAPQAKIAREEVDGKFSTLPIIVKATLETIVLLC